MKLSLLKRVVCALMAFTFVISTLLAQDTAMVKPLKEVLPVKPLKVSSMAQVARYLNTDGDFYMYMNSDKFGTKVMKGVDLLQKIASFDKKNNKAQMEMGFKVIRAVLKESGLIDVRAVGMSSVQIAEKTHSYRTVVYHGPEQTKGEIWKIIGGKPHKFSALKLMPKNTVIAFNAELHIDVLWTLVTTYIRNTDPEGEKKLEQIYATTQMMGLNLDELIASLAGEVTIIVTMNPEVMHKLPEGPDLSIPDMSVMIALSTKNDKLFETLKIFSSQNPAITPVEIPGASAIMQKDISTAPVRLSPTVAQADGVLLFGTNPGIIKQALAVRAGGEGLTSTDDFKRLSKNLPRKGSRLTFVSSKLVEQFKSLIQTAFENDKSNKLPEEAREIINQELSEESFELLEVAVYHDDALVTYGNSSASLGDVMLLSTVPVPAVLAGFLMPALANARRTAQGVERENQMRQEAEREAKEQEVEEQIE